MNNFSTITCSRCFFYKSTANGGLFVGHTDQTGLVIIAHVCQCCFTMSKANQSTHMQRTPVALLSSLTSHHHPCMATPVWRLPPPT